MKTNLLLPMMTVVLLQTGCTLNEAPDYPGYTSYSVGYAGYRNYNEYSTYVPYYWGPQHYYTTDYRYSPGLKRANMFD